MTKNILQCLKAEIMLRFSITIGEATFSGYCATEMARIFLHPVHLYA